MAFKWIENVRLRQVVKPRLEMSHKWGLESTIVWKILTCISLNIFSGTKRKWKPPKKPKTGTSKKARIEAEQSSDDDDLEQLQDNEALALQLLGNWNMMCLYFQQENISK